MINNGFMYSCCIMIHQHAITMSVVDVLKRKTHIIETIDINPIENVPQLKGGIDDFLEKNGIDVSIIPIHIIIDELSFNINDQKSITNSLIKGNPSDKLSVSRIVDVMAYKVWADKTHITQKKNGYRLILIRTNKITLSVGLVESGIIVRNINPNIGYDYRSDMSESSYSYMMNKVHDEINRQFNPDDIIYDYIEPLPRIPYGLRELNIMDRKTSEMNDINDGISLIDSASMPQSVPDFIRNKNSDYGDFYVSIDDDNGNQISIPIFQNEDRQEKA